MNLLSRAKELLNNGKLAASAAICIAPLAASTADADIYFGEETALTLENYDMTDDNAGAVDNALATYFDGFVDGTGKAYSFILQMGGSGSTDQQWFEATNNSARSARFFLYGTLSGSFDASETLQFDYTITTFLRDGTTTSVSYNGMLVSVDGIGQVRHFTAESTFPEIFNTSDWGSAGYGDDLSESLTASSYQLSGEQMGDLDLSMWYLSLSYDWDQSGAFTADEFLAVHLSGTVSAVAVPEPATWSFLGSLAAFGATLLGRRRWKTGKTS